MAAGTGNEASSSRFVAFVLALAAITAAFAFVAPSVGHAQEQEGTGLLNRLFGSERVKPRAIVEPSKSRKKRTARPSVDGAEPPQLAVVSKQSDARVVLVVGDFLAGGLAEGLTTAVVQNPNVRIVDRSNGSSGFVRKDFYDWSERIDDLIKADRPAAIIVMIGANDRQQMLVDGVRETVRSQSWSREYARRAEELAKAITARNVPLLWVGMPPFKSSKMMLDMLAFNEVYRAAAVSAGGEYVDIWDGFVDENGAYISNGPDLNGQPARLRASDGINLARPGKRKLAFYAEKPLYRLLGEDPAAAAAQVSALAARPAYRLFGPFGPSEQQEPADLDVVVDPNEIGPIDPARPVALRTPALDGGAELLGAVAAPRHEAVTPAEKLAIEGFAPTPPAGRADQFASPQFAAAATATRQVNIDATLNKKVAPSGPLLTAVDHAALRTVRSNVLTEPQPLAPPRIPPEIRPDRAEEISPLRAAPDVAAAEPPMMTPATIDKATVPDFAKGDALDLAPARAAPQESFKRPKSIGPEPNRAPTAVPQPAVEIFTPAEAEPEIPSASAGEGTAEPADDAKPALPDGAPARAPVPSTEPGLAEDRAPARAAPRNASPVPVAALPQTKDAPTEIGPAPIAPAAVVPSVPIEPATGMAAAKAVGIGPAAISGGAPARSAPASEPTETAGAPANAAPTAAPAASAAPLAPAAPSILPERTDGATSLPEPGNIDGQAARPATPVAPAPSTTPPEKASTPSTIVPRRKAELSLDPPAAPPFDVPAVEHP